MITRWLAIHGTHDSPLKPSSWCHGGSALVTEFTQAGLQLLDADRRWFWSGNVDGILLDRNTDWPAAVESLFSRLLVVPFQDRNLLAHSHGGAVALLTAVHLPIRSLITVGTPTRKSIREAGARALALKHIRTWRHVYDQVDVWRTLGGLFDGEVRFSGAFSLPGMTDHRIRGISHSKTLYEPRYRELRRDWINLLRAAGAEQGV